MLRADGRHAEQLRPITFEMGATKWAEGSVLVRAGDTHVLCNATLEKVVPRWLYLSNSEQGWLTAEYALLPRSTQVRAPREQRWPKGRTQEIARLIGRSLRMALDLKALGQRQVIVDCDVLQADGGTRTAAVTGGWLALQLALRPLIQRGELPAHVFRRQVAAVSVGLVTGRALLDLSYEEDVAADADLNVVMTAEGHLIEVQGTGEKAPISRRQFDELLTRAERGIQELLTLQRLALEQHMGRSAPQGKR